VRSGLQFESNGLTTKILACRLASRLSHDAQRRYMLLSFPMSLVTLEDES